MSRKTRLIELLKAMPIETPLTVRSVLEALTDETDETKSEESLKRSLAYAVEAATQDVRRIAKEHALRQTRVIVPQDMRMVAAKIFSQGKADTIQEAAYKVMFEKQWMKECGKGYEDSSGF